MNSLCIHVADMKVTTFSNKTQHFATNSECSACRNAPGPRLFRAIVDTDGTVLLCRHA
jgi:hypothetical protein